MFAVCHMTGLISCFKLLLCVFHYCLEWAFVMFYSVADKYKLVHTTDAADPYPFARRVFTGWDYAVSFADTARRKALHIATEFKVFIHMWCSTVYLQCILCRK